MTTVISYISEGYALGVLNIRPGFPCSSAGLLYRVWKSGTAGGTRDAQPAALRMLSRFEQEAAEDIRVAHGSRFASNYLQRAPLRFFASICPPGDWSLDEEREGYEDLEHDCRVMAEDFISANLRASVDDWIATGIRSDGSETPTSRDLLAARVGLRALKEHLTRFEQAVVYKLERRGITLIMGQPVQPRSCENFFEAQITAANRIWAGIQTSEWKNCLCKCRYTSCGRYFIHPKLRRFYKHGTFCCREHQSRASAGALTESRRSCRVSALVDLAARKLAFLKIDRKYKNDKGLKRQLADCLSAAIAINPNLRVGSGEQVKANFITRHWAEIEKQSLSGDATVTMAVKAGPK